MNSQICKLRLKKFALPLVLLFISTNALAHDVVGADGKPTHQHVYKRDAYGNNLIAGHAGQIPGSKGIVIWQSAPSQAYGKAQSGVRVPKNPFSKKNPRQNQKNMYKQKPAFSKNQKRIPTTKPQ